MGVPNSLWESVLMIDDMAEVDALPIELIPCAADVGRAVLKAVRGGVDPESIEVEPDSEYGRDGRLNRQLSGTAFVRN